MRTILLSMLLALMACLAGCATWHNPNIVDQSKADEILAHDRAYCEKYSEAMVPIEPGNQPVPYTSDLVDEVQVNSAEYDANFRQTDSFDKCMRSKGWRKD